MLSARFDDALVWAHQLHRDHARKGSGVPYISHLLAVAALVLEDGGSENEAVAALLHDAIEDTDATAEDVERRFGAEVAAIVVGCSDATTRPRPPWRERKQRYLANLEHDASEAVLRVAGADKLHNARWLLIDHRREGEALWPRFNAGADDQLWYYGSLVRIFVARRPHSLLTADLALTVKALGEEVSG